jgi:hypothetical protein
MKKLRSSSPQGRKLACTVSAAALMLGVSSAATVGLNFTVDYCGFTNYVNYVNAPAFGVPVNQWQNLVPMGTGYHTCSGSPTFDEDQIINTTTSDGGLHPLPNGSIEVYWSAATANWSGFSGYDPSTPPEPINSGPVMPEAEVYAGFLRDGVNFGPGSSGGDNNQSGYFIEIHGLKSVFTNTPFVIQLIAASDSMQSLTNAFITDATANTTQSVTYPNPQVYDDVGDTPWYRSNGGGLSTSSTALNTDHIQITGNQAAHGGNENDGSGYNFASTISGAIITDKPVVTMSPQPVVVCRGDTVTWSAFALGVPPLSYQWRKDGTPIPGANSTSYSVANVNSPGTYDLVVTNLYGSATSAPVSIDLVSLLAASGVVADTNPSGPEQDGLAFGGWNWLGTNTDSSSVTRTGVFQFIAASGGQVTVGGRTNFDSRYGTISFWMRSPAVSGRSAILFDRRSGFGRNGGGASLALTSSGQVLFETDHTANSVQSSATVADNKWHHIAVVFNQDAFNYVTLYIDGATDNANFNNQGWNWVTAQEIELGCSHDTNSWQPYNGMLDDVRLYNRQLDSSEVASVRAGNLVDTNALVLRFNFDTAPQAGSILSWRCSDAILQSADSLNGPWADVPSATAPYLAVRRTSTKYFRYRGHIPVTIISNPYFM